LSKEPVTVSCTDVDGGTDVGTSEDILSSEVEAKELKKLELNLRLAAMK
jgi:hypothetical protein